MFYQLLCARHPKQDGADTLTAETPRNSKLCHSAAELVSDGEKVHDFGLLLLAILTLHFVFEPLISFDGGPAGIWDASIIFASDEATGQRGQGD